MAARLLAYGGTSFSERRRIGAWPPVPEATLRDSYGLLINGWCFGMGVLDRRPFLIFRQRQNVASRGGYPFSLLLDPGEPVWVRFAWNAAAIVDAVLRSNPDLLFRNPETCTLDALERCVADLPPPRPIFAQTTPFSYLMVAAVMAPAPIVIGYPDRPDPATIAGALAALPVCFRAGSGWLVGGGSAHGRALGACVVVDDPASAPPSASIEAGRNLLASWQSADRRGVLQAHPDRPLWTWPEPPAEYLASVLLLRDLEAAESAGDELVSRAESATVLKPEIDGALEALLTRGSAPLGAKASALLIGFVLRGQRKLPPLVAGRLHPDTLRTELRRFGAPPKPVPKGLPVDPGLRLTLWVEYLEALQSDVAKSLADALAQLQPDPADTQALVHAALAALPASDEKLTAWKRFRANPELWALLETPLQEEAARRARREPERDELHDALRSVLFESNPDNVEERASDLVVRFEKAGAPQTLAPPTQEECERFAAAFFTRYAALGDVMRFLSGDAQDRLLDCFPNVAEFAARDISFALNNKASRNAYTRALARLLIKDKKLLGRVAMELSELPGDLENKLKPTLAKRKA